METTYDAVVVGSGPAGYTAALYLARADISTLVLEGATPGGCLMSTSDVENYPGFDEGVRGPELIGAMRRQAARFGADLVAREVARIERHDPWFLVATEGDVVRARVVVVATGSTPRRLGLARELELTGRGVSTCATCDGAFFVGQHVIVVGGGDSAMEEALQLARLSATVTLVHRRSSFRASPIMASRVDANPRISVLTDTVVTALNGEDVVESVDVRDLRTGAVSTIAAAGLFVAVGHDPQSDLVSAAGLAEVDEAGYVRVRGRSSLTGTPGLFACGDVIDPTYRQAVSAAGSGCVAALDAQRHLQDTTVEFAASSGVLHAIV
jgi:thioredoxin reductase (NADPH)